MTYQISSDAIKMGADMANFLCGPGFDGFLAWLDQDMAAGKCECGRVHLLEAKKVRRNLDLFREAFDAASD